ANSAQAGGDIFGSPNLCRPSPQRRICSRGQTCSPGQTCSSSRLACCRTEAINRAIVGQQLGRLAQLVERLLYTQNVGGSSPSPPTSLRKRSARRLPRRSPIWAKAGTRRLLRLGKPSSFSAWQRRAAYAHSTCFARMLQNGLRGPKK